jgi:hypothetical protein
MGWNSWDCFGTTVTEDEVHANAEFMAAHISPHGWDTVVVDIQWYEPAAKAGGYNDGAALLLDGFGRQLPAVNRFPSAADGKGFARLATRIHLRSNAQMWRVSDDLWDNWDDVVAPFARMARWAPHQLPGAWADADMLPVGRIAHRAEHGLERLTRLTLDGQRTMMMSV